MTFQTLLIFILLAILACFVFCIKNGSFTIRFEKQITTINKMDELQLEVAKANLEELKRYNEASAKNAQDTNRSLQTITAAAQAFMGVNDDETNRN